MIHEDAVQCRFCSLAIDPGVAELIAGRQELVNQACSDASYLRRTAVGMYVFLVGATIFSFAYGGFLITFWMGLFLLIRWHVKFNDLLTNDPDYAKAKHSRTISLFLLLGGVPLGILANPFLLDALALILPD
jgi:hypothetical protein